MEPASDAPMSAARDGGASAVRMSDAVARYEARLIRYATHLVGDVDRARDVVQDTFIALWRANPYQVNDREAAWLHTVCRNRALDVLRRERSVDPLDAAASRKLPAPDPSPTDLAVIHDDHQRVLAAVSRLPSNQQEVLRLKLQAELNYREISEVTGLSESNVGYLIHVAIHAVRDHLRAAECAAPPTG